MYHKLRNEKEIYDDDGSGKQIVLQHQTRYANDEFGEPYYPKDNLGNDYRPSHLPYIKFKGEYKLPLNSMGLPLYPTAPNSNDQLYLVSQNVPHIARGADGDQYYAKDSKGNEFYPLGITKPESKIYYPGTRKLNPIWFAKTKYNLFKYALSVNGETIFPKNMKKNEFYLGTLNAVATPPTRYARIDEGDEVYPKRQDADGLLHDALLNMSYARNKQGHFFYPKDAYNNEFYLSTQTETNPLPGTDNIISILYATTKDLRIIVPRINGQPWFDDRAAPTDLSNTDLKGRIVREGNAPSDYLSSRTYGRATSSDLHWYRYVDSKGHFNEVNAQMPKPAHIASQPAQIVPKPVQSVPKPVQIPQPVQVPQPAQIAPQPVQIAPQPVQVPQPAQIAPQPVQIAPQPVQVPQPAQIAPQPVQIAPQPVQSVPSSLKIWTRYVMWIIILVIVGLFVLALGSVAKRPLIATTIHTKI